MKKFANLDMILTMENLEWELDILPKLFGKEVQN